ncbi:MAG: hypothetical protein ACYDBJ_06275 [Aggregatilineales bacterium]
MVKTGLPVLGVLLCLVGIVWLLQGLNLLPGSFMTGVLFWAFAGAVLLIAGVGLILYSVRSRRSTR